jgi:hypothetical protein
MVNMYILVGHRHPWHFAPEDLDHEQYCCQNIKSGMVLLHSSALRRHTVNVYGGAENEFHTFLTSALRELESTGRVSPGMWPWQLHLTTVNVVECIQMDSQSNTQYTRIFYTSQIHVSAITKYPSWGCKQNDKEMIYTNFMGEKLCNWNAK